HQVAGGLLQIVVGAEAEVVVLLLRRGVHPAALIAREGPLLVVSRDDVLPQRPAQPLQPVAEVPDHREVVEDGVAALEDVVEPDEQDRAEQDQDRDEHRREGTTTVESFTGPPHARGRSFRSPRRARSAYYEGKPSRSPLSSRDRGAPMDDLEPPS